MEISNEIQNYLSLAYCVVGIIGGAFFSLIISFLFYIKGLKRKRLIYSIRTYCIIPEISDEDIEGLEVKYNTEKINNLYSTFVTIRNIGNVIIEQQDFATICPIALTTKGQFLKIHCESSHVTNITPQIVKNENGDINKIIFNFDYIKKKIVLFVNFCIQKI